jgi:hypothetical protein
MELITILKALFLALFLGATISGNILGTIKQQFGKSWVFATWKGIQYARKYVVPANPNTLGQQSQRTCFKETLLFSQIIITSIIQKFWKKQAVKMSSFNAFMKVNLLLQSSPVTKNLFQFAKGTLTETPIDSATYNAGNGKVAIGWDTTLSGNMANSDKAVGIIVDGTGVMTPYVLDNNTARITGTFDVPALPGQNPANLYAYLFFYRDLGTQNEKMSNSTKFVVS